MASQSLVDWWNERLPFIEAQARADDAAGKNGNFEWGQMVWQELEMWERSPSQWTRTSSTGS